MTGQAVNASKMEDRKATNYTANDLYVYNTDKSVLKIHPQLYVITA